MAFELPALPYAQDALEPHISSETLEYHYGKHHKTYVDKLNGLAEGTDLASKSLEEVVKSSEGGVFNNAAQIWNHTFYWNCLSPNGGGEATGAVPDAINAAFGSFDAFKEAFALEVEAVRRVFGDGQTPPVRSRHVGRRGGLHAGLFRLQQFHPRFQALARHVAP